MWSDNLYLWIIGSESILNKATACFDKRVLIRLLLSWISIIANGLVGHHILPRRPIKRIFTRFILNKDFYVRVVLLTELNLGQLDGSLCLIFKVLIWGRFDIWVNDKNFLRMGRTLILFWVIRLPFCNIDFIVTQSLILQRKRYDFNLK
jgi:hypothetical protein